MPELIGIINTNTLHPLQLLYYQFKHPELEDLFNNFNDESFDFDINDQTLTILLQIGDPDFMNYILTNYLFDDDERNIIINTMLIKYIILHDIDNINKIIEYINLR